ncbi:hypothetical protein [Domibacillus robiginosus]|uniref:hypothetical protein n=1 Tax=Domibacillus robiginosus TaxID=1071054 RepID=UPI00067AC8A8|nr:hypothetical protein [Domibacillus robiginosus]
MKKKKRKKSGNVVQFPGTSARLQQQGQQALEKKRFDEAIRLYTEALRFEDEHQEDIKTALLIAYHESGSHDEGIELSRAMLHAGEGQYFDVLDLHVLMLIQKRRYKEVAETLSVLLEEGLPPDRYEHFAHLKALADRMSVKKEEVLFKPSDFLQDKIMKLAELAKTDPAPFKEELIDRAGDKTEHPFIQTMAIGLLRDIGTAEKVWVRKFQLEKEIIPVMEGEAFSQPFFKEVIELLEETAGQNEPALFEQAVELARQYQFLLYPFDPPASIEQWAEAIAAKIKRLYEMDSVKEVSAEMEAALLFMKELDEISAF